MERHRTAMLLELHPSRRSARPPGVLLHAHLHQSVPRIEARFVLNTTLHENRRSLKRFTKPPSCQHHARRPRAGKPDGRLVISPDRKRVKKGERVSVSEDPGQTRNIK